MWKWFVCVFSNIVHFEMSLKAMEEDFKKNKKQFWCKVLFMTLFIFAYHDLAALMRGLLHLRHKDCCSILVGAYGGGIGAAASGTGAPFIALACLPCPLHSSVSLASQLLPAGMRKRDAKRKMRPGCSLQGALKGEGKKCPWRQTWSQWWRHFLIASTVLNYNFEALHFS